MIKSVHLTMPAQSSLPGSHVVFAQQWSHVQSAFVESALAILIPSHLGISKVIWQRVSALIPLRVGEVKPLA